MTLTKYETRPLECWQKAKEMRLRHYQSLPRAREDGKLLAIGSGSTPWELLAGFGPFEVLRQTDYGGSIGNMGDMAEQAFESLEARGYARDLCGYCRAFLGSMLLDRYVFGGPFPKPDFIVTGLICDNNGKFAQIVAEHLRVPYFYFDVPLALTYTRDYDSHLIDYMVTQFQVFIERVSRLTKREYNDEKLFEGIYNRCKSEVLWARIMELNQTVPAPLDLKSQYSLFVPLLVAPYSKESVEFYTALLDEVKHRVDGGIAALSTERCRLFHDGIPVWHSLRYFREPEKYGAVYVGSFYSMIMFGAFEEGEDGRLVARKSPDEMGITFRSREDALRFMASWHLDRMTRSGYTAQVRAWGQLKLLPQWKIDGMIYHLNRGCAAQSSGLLDTKAMVEEKLKLPTMVYEANSVDRREWDEKRVMDSLEAFLARLGLSELPD